jgi:hypothetical protein
MAWVLLPVDELLRPRTERDPPVDPCKMAADDPDADEPVLPPN